MSAMQEQCNLSSGASGLDSADGDKDEDHADRDSSSGAHGGGGGAHASVGMQASSARSAPPHRMAPAKAPAPACPLAPKQAVTHTGADTHVVQPASAAALGGVTCSNAVERRQLPVGCVSVQHSSHASATVSKEPTNPSIGASAGAASLHSGMPSSSGASNTMMVQPTKTMPPPPPKPTADPAAVTGLPLPLSRGEKWECGEFVCTRVDVRDSDSRQRFLRTWRARSNRAPEPPSLHTRGWDACSTLCASSTLF